MTNSLLSTLPLFPQELLELFVEAVGDLPASDPFRIQALLACNLVSRSFCHISRRHLFKRVIIQDDFEDLLVSLPALHALMTWTQHKSYSLQGIARYIKEFSFHISIPDVGEKITRLDNNSALANVLRSLHSPYHGIHTLVLFFHWQSVEWNSFSRGLQKTLHDLVRSPRLRYLRICNINCLPSTFLRGTHIQHLYLHECLAEDDARSGFPPHFCELPYPTLEVLDTDHELPLSFFEHSSRPTSDSSINQLRVLSSSVFVFQDFEMALEVVERSRESLERLDLRYYVLETPLAPSSGSFDLSAVPNLRHLCLYHSGGTTLSQGPGLALNDITLLLESITPPSSGSLHTVELVILMNGVQATTQPFLDSFRSESYKWTMLDAALTRACFHSVRNVVMSFHFERPVANELPHGKSAFGEKARVLVRKSLASITGSREREEGKPELRIDIAFSSQIESWTPRTLEVDENPM